MCSLNTGWISEMDQWTSENLNPQILISIKIEIIFNKATRSLKRDSPGSILSLDALD